MTPESYRDQVEFGRYAAPAPVLHGHMAPYMVPPLTMCLCGRDFPFLSSLEKHLKKVRVK